MVDTWWQTETGMILIAPLPGATPTRPGSATLPLPGIEAAIVDAHGKPVPTGSGGLLVLRRPWPAMMRTLWGDDARHREVYWDRFSKPGRAGLPDGRRRGARPRRTATSASSGAWTTCST